jgi:hypothetical protein
MHGRKSIHEDIRNTDFLVKKIRDNSIYAQNLYAGLCNNGFIKNGEDDGNSFRENAVFLEELCDLDYYQLYWSGGSSVENKEYKKWGELTSEVEQDLLKIGWKHSN